MCSNYLWCFVRKKEIVELNVETLNDLNKNEIKKGVYSELNGGIKFKSLGIVLSLVKAGVFGGICVLCVLCELLK